MSRLFEELDYQKTSLGELVLRRRQSPNVPGELVYEVKLDNEMLMSSSVNASEQALARLVLDRRKDRPVDVLIGGLGLGHTAAAALEYGNIRQVVVMELLKPVISWHRRRLVPLAGTLMDDQRCRIVEGDFFEHVRSDQAAGKYEAILLDIDHAPDCLLQQGHDGFYTAAGLQALARNLRPGGMFALWSAWKPTEEFIDVLSSVFSEVEQHKVSFYNPHMNEKQSNWIITAK